MQFAGSHTFKAPRQVLWNLLNDPDVLARTTPGIESLEQTDADQYQAVLQVKMGPINSAFNGTPHVVDKSEPESYRLLLIDVDGKIGSQLTGRLARMGQRLLSGVAPMFTNQFFKALEKELPR